MNFEHPAWLPLRIIVTILQPIFRLLWFFATPIRWYGRWGWHIGMWYVREDITRKQAVAQLIRWWLVGDVILIGTLLVVALGYITYHHGVALAISNLSQIITKLPEVYAEITTKEAVTFFATLPVLMILLALFKQFYKRQNLPSWVMELIEAVPRPKKAKKSTQ